MREESTKAGSILLKANDSPIQFPNNLFIASDDLIKNHKPLLQKFVNVMRESVAWVRQHPEDAAGVCAKRLGATVGACMGFIKLSFDKSITNQWTWSSTLAVNVEGVKSALAVMAVVDPKTVGLTLDDVVDSSFAGTTP